MDTLTHAIIGATLARATASKTQSESSLSVKSRVWIGGLAAAFPDIDFFALWVNPLAFISDWHRAETHSFIMLPLWALLLGFIFAVVIKRKQHWREIALVCAISIFSHIFTDLITSWGTQIFAPFSNYRASWGTTFIIDPYFTLIILTGLVVALLRQSRVAAQMGVAVLVTYIGLQALLKLQAFNIGQDYVDAKGWQQASISTLPQAFSPFHWKIIVSEAGRYYMAYVDLIAAKNKPMPDKYNTALIHSIYYYRPKQNLIWSQYPRYGLAENAGLAKLVWQQPLLDPYRRFASHPVLYRIDKTATNNCVWFMDLRFVMPQRTTPFRYGLCKLINEKDWKLYRLKRGQNQEKQRIANISKQKLNKTGAIPLILSIDFRLSLA